MSEAGPKLLRGLLEVFILESLEQAPKHGYALLKEVTEAFGAEPNRNRLYPLLAKMVRDGYIREMSEAGGNRTLYTLTDSGRDALHAYRRLPAQFRHALRRIWNVELPHHHGPPAPHAAPSHAAPAEPTAPTSPAAPASAASAAAPAAPLGSALAAPAAAPRAPDGLVPVRVETRTPASVPEMADGALPYPCPEARVVAEKDPRTGDLAIRLTGCPMGAYEYCPQCPVSQSLSGLRRLLLP